MSAVLPQCGHTRLTAGCVDCVALEREWYCKARDSGFDEIENVKSARRLLKSWSGVSIQVCIGDSELVDILDLVVYQEPHEPLQSSFPQSSITAKERLLHHPEFDRLCETICGHGNHRMTPAQVSRVWVEYLDGGSNRSIAGLLGINDSCVFRTISTLTQWADLMDVEDDEPVSAAKVVLRPFHRKVDEPFIYASWRNSLWFDKADRREGESDRFFRQTTKMIRTTLDAPKTKVRIACLSDSPVLIIGYCVVNSGCLCFVYVKADYRNKRIGSLLVPRGINAIAEPFTKIGRAIAEKKGFIKPKKENEVGKAKETPAPSLTLVTTTEQ